MLKKIGKTVNIDIMKNRNNTKILLVTFILFIFSNIYCLADNPPFQVTVDRKEITLLDTIQLKLTLSGNTKLNKDFELPEIHGFNSQYAGQSSNMTIINGSYSSTTSYTYTLYPLEEGSFVISAIGVHIKGQIYTSNPIDIKVVKAKEGVNSANKQAPVKLEDKIFMTFESSKKNLFLYEKATFIIRLYFNNVNIGDVQLPVFNDKNLSVGEYNKPRQYQEILGGINNNVVEFKTNFYPTQTGTINIGSAVLGCNVLYRRSGGRAPSFGGLFNDDFFNSVFDRVEKMPIQVKSKGLSINVLPLPYLDPNVPFSGGVGNFNFEMTASPKEVKTGDPITIKMNVSGSGNLAAIKMPAFKDSADFKVYEPHVKEENGKKILEQVLIPKNDKVKEISPIVFRYFNPSSKQYEVIKKGPIIIKVLKSSNEDRFRVFDESSKYKISSNPEKIGRDIIYIKEIPGRVIKKGYWFYNSIKLKVLYIIISIFYLMMSIFYTRFKKIKTDVAYARGINAAKKAKNELRNIKKLIYGEDLKEFYDNLFRIIREYLGARMNISSSGLTTKEIEFICKKRNVSEEIKNKLISLLEKCDQVKFASIAQDIDDARDNITVCEQIINYFERNIK